MENLKITFNFSLPFVADRLTTIDSILLKEYFSIKRKKGEHTEFNDDLSMIDFIEQKNGVLSGSIWYIPEDAPLKLDFTNYYKKPEPRKIFDASLLFDSDNPLKNDFFKSQGKAYKLEEEIILTPKVYFYIRGKRKPIEQLLSRVKSFGKKRSIGFGSIEEIRVQTMDEDFSFQLNDTTPSKPLPVESFNIKSKKIIHYRSIPPYWDNKNLVPCYMPSTALFEIKDTSIENSKFKVSNSDISGSSLEFAAEVMDGKQGLTKISETKLLEDKRKKRWDITDSNTTQYCCFTGTITKSGITNAKAYLSIKMDTFTSQGIMGRGNFLSTIALWGAKREMIQLSGDSILTKAGMKKLTENGAQEGERYKDYMKNPLMLNPPFAILRKTTASKQEHLLLSSRVSISNAFFSVQFGDNALFIDTELLLQAVKDIRKILTLDGGPSKSHLLGLWTKGVHPELNKKSTQKRIFNL